MVSEKISVVIARFQVPTLTEGHKHILNHAKQQGKLVVVLGVAPTSPKNPLTFQMRRDMVQSEIPGVHMIVPHNDCPGDNDKWSKGLNHLLDLLFPGALITLYCGRDGFKEHYDGPLLVKQVPYCTEYSGSDARREIAEGGPINTPQFRQGVIWAVEHYLPKEQWKP